MGSAHKEYFTHIAGLRAVAIVLVMLFHLNAGAWPQGYVGVDVFLVITGYLLFYKGGRQNSEVGVVRSTCAYLGKRVQRIVPPMLIVTLLTVLASAYLFRAVDQYLICRLGYNICLGKSNMFLTRAFENYFAPDAAYNPLLHMWYLSMLLQIYALSAVAYAAARYVPRRLMVWLLMALGCVSLGYCYSFPVHEWLREQGVAVWHQYRGVSYYATLPRLWEVLAGGLVCVLPSAAKRSLATLAAGAGLACILLSGVGLVPACTWAVVAGSVAVIRYMPESHIGGLLSIKPLQWLGNISFSVYLVHMPIIVFVRAWSLGSMGAGEECLALCASLVVGAAYWVAVEKRRFPLWSVLLLWVAVGMLCRVGYKKVGLDPYLPSFGLKPAPIEHAPYRDWQLCHDPEWCAAWPSLLNPYGDIFKIMQQDEPAGFKVPLFIMGQAAHKPSVLLVGDSHAMHAYAGMDAAFRRENLSGLYLASIIFPLHGWRVKSNSYTFDEQKEAALMAWLEKHPEITHIIIAQRWRERCRTVKNDAAKMEQDLRAFLVRLRQMGRHVILIGPSPEYGMQASVYEKVLALRGKELADLPVSLTRESFEMLNALIYPMLERMEAERLCTLLDVRKVMKPDESFPVLLNGGLMMVDDNHLSPTGSRWFIDLLFPQLRDALRQGDLLPES